MHALPRLLALALAATVVLAGCGDKDDQPPNPVAGESPPTSSASPTPTPTPSPSPSPTPPATLADALLPADEVTGLNESWVWQEDGTVAAEQELIGYCSRYDVFTLGAEEALHRTYAAPAGSEPELNRAGELIARFPDEATANRAFQVLLSWHRGCAKRINPDVEAKVGPVAYPQTPGAKAFWYLVTVPEFDMDPGSFSAFGVAVVGDRIAILTMDSGGPDFTYPRGREPMVGMLRAAAARLG